MTYLVDAGIPAETFTAGATERLSSSGQATAQKACKPTDEFVSSH